MCQAICAHLNQCLLFRQFHLRLCEPHLKMVHILHTCWSTRKNHDTSRYREQTKNATNSIPPHGSKMDPDTWLDIGESITCLETPSSIPPSLPPHTFDVPSMSDMRFLSAPILQNRAKNFEFRSFNVSFNHSIHIYIYIFLLWCHVIYIYIYVYIWKIYGHMTIYACVNMTCAREGGISDLSRREAWISFSTMSNGSCIIDSASRDWCREQGLGFRI